MKRKPSRVVTKARIHKAASVYIQARRAASQSVILDRHPTFGERFLCYWVGGIDELQVTLEAVKSPGTTHASN